MANKFLPFIVEKSPLHSIYQTMLTRSKGVNTLTFLGVFASIGEYGIKSVREYVDSQPDNTDTNTLYQSVSNYFKHGVDQEDYDAFLLLVEVMKLEDLKNANPKFNEFGYADIIGFIYVTALLERSSEYFTYDYNLYLSSHRDVLNDFRKYIVIDDENPDFIVPVKSESDLLAKVLFYSLLYTGPNRSYKFEKAEHGTESQDPTPYFDMKHEPKSPEDTDGDDSDEQGVPF